jgi:short-subunit dehydrogenase
LTNRVLPHLKASGGQIVNASSVAGKVALPYMGAYCASKYALNAYAASLRSELECSGVGVTNLIIGRVSTGFSLRSKGGKTPPQTPGRTTAQMYARHVIRGIVKRKHEVVFPGWYRYIIGFYALAPRFLERLARRRFEASPPFTQEEK